MSNRTFDESGRLTIGVSNISKEAVNPYLGSEIPDGEELGLIPDKIYYMYRPAEELIRAVETFKRIPILSRHTPSTADNPQKQFVAGTVGSNVFFESPYLKADSSFWDGESIDYIESGVMTEFSIGYTYETDWTPGEFNGVKYDGIMREIKGNHLALVEKGRAGPDVMVGDSFPILIEKDKMKFKTKLGAALAGAVSGMSKKINAADLAPIFNGFKKGGKFDYAPILAMDSDLDSETLVKVIDAIADVAEEDKDKPVMPMGDESGKDKEDAAAKDEGPEAALRAMLKAAGVAEGIINDACALMGGGSARDEYKEEVVESKIKQATDSAIKIIEARFKAAEQARLDVEPVIGRLQVVGDSAENIYKTALAHLNVEHDGVSDTAALRAIFKAASGAEAARTASMGMDAALQAGAAQKLKTRFGDSLSRIAAR